VTNAIFDQVGSNIVVFGSGGEVVFPSTLPPSIVINPTSDVVTGGAAHATAFENAQLAGYTGTETDFYNAWVAMVNNPANTPYSGGIAINVQTGNIVDLSIDKLATAP